MKRKTRSKWADDMINGLAAIVLPHARNGCPECRKFLGWKVKKNDLR